MATNFLSLSKNVPLTNAPLSFCPICNTSSPRKRIAGIMLLGVAAHIFPPKIIKQLFDGAQLTSGIGSFAGRRSPIGLPDSSMLVCGFDKFVDHIAKTIATGISAIPYASHVFLGEYFLAMAGASNASNDANAPKLHQTPKIL